MKALVTGSTGFVGSHLVRLLVEQGHQVRVLHRASSRLDSIADLDVEHAIGDLTDLDKLPELLQGVDWVFHTAAVADYWRQGKEKIYQVNVDGTKALLEAALQAGVKRFIFTSSAAAVGHRRDGHTANEDTYFNVDPELSPYGHSKFLAEVEVYRAIERGLDAVMVNPAVIIGPGDLNLISGSLVLEVAKGTLFALPEAGGTTFIDVRDVAWSHLKAAEQGRCGERYLLGNVNMTHRAMFRLIADVINVPSPKLTLPDVVMPVVAGLADLGRKLGIDLPADGNQLRLSQLDLYFDCSKAWRDLWEPKIDLRQSIRDTYQWYAEHGYLTPLTQQ